MDFIITTVMGLKSINNFYHFFLLKWRIRVQDCIMVTEEVYSWMFENGLRAKAMLSQDPIQCLSSILYFSYSQHQLFLTEKLGNSEENLKTQMGSIRTC